MKYPIYKYDIIQNSDEWFAEKLGMFSASYATDLLMDKKNKGYINLIDKIVEERVTGERCESSSFIGNKYTERGHELEPIAREDYEFRTLSIVDIVGVVIMDEWTLCSPDGLIGEDKHHQIKCPIFKTQKHYLDVVAKNKELEGNYLMQKIDNGYYKQLQFELMVTGRECNIFTSYHPKLKAIDIHVHRDEALIKIIRHRLTEAIEEVKIEIEKIKSY